MALLETFQYDGTTLTGLTTLSGSASISNGRFLLDCSGSYTTLETAAGDLTGSYFMAEVVAPSPYQVQGIETGIEVHLTQNVSSLEMDITEGVIICLVRDGGSNADAGTPYNPTQHRFLRIRQASTQVFFEASPDASTWTALRTVSNPSWSMTSVKGAIWNGYWTGTGDPADAVFGPINMVPSSLSTPTFVGAGSAVATANNVANPTNLSPTKHADTQTGDAMFLVTTSRSSTATVGSISGWTQLTTAASGTASGGTIYVFGRIADGSGLDAPTVAWSGLTTGTSGDSCLARIVTYRNCSITTTGTATTTDAAATTSLTMPTFTPGAADAAIICAGLRVNDTAHTFTSRVAHERGEAHTTTGTGHGQLIYDLNAQGTSATGTRAIVPSNTTSSRTLLHTFAVLASPTSLGPGEQVVDVDPASETNTAPSFSVSTTRSVAITAASETDTAQGVTASATFSTAISEASETNTAQGVDVEASVSAALSEASETDTAQGVGFSSSQSVDVETVEETDTAGDVGLETSESVALTEASETDTAQGVVVPSLVTIAQASETDTAQGVGVESSVGVELTSASETDTAQGVFLAQGVAVSTASETDSASDLEVELATSLAVGTAEESDLAEQIVVDGGDAPVRTIAQEPWQGYIPY